MAGLVKGYKVNSYTDFTEQIIGANSLTVANGNFISMSWGFGILSLANANILWVSITDKTFSSTNQTVAQEKIIYRPLKTRDQFKLPVLGITLTFAGALITDNVVNLKVNGVAMTPVTFTVNDATTLTAIGTQLVTDFPTLIASVATGTNTLLIKPYNNNSLVSITNIVVTLWTSQTTGSVANKVLVNADIGKFADIEDSDNQALNYYSMNASSSGLALEIKDFTEGGSYAIVTIVNG